jgi:hypothetical protein
LEVVEVLPHNPAGKVLKFELRGPLGTSGEAEVTGCASVFFWPR